VKTMPVDALQGFHFSKPVPAPIFQAYLENGGPLPAAQTVEGSAASH
jgi:EAL domain-containing protein (putative c-di-GMP-specific phosphodiesterase class I)